MSILQRDGKNKNCYRATLSVWGEGGCRDSVPVFWAERCQKI